MLNPPDGNCSECRKRTYCKNPCTAAKRIATQKLIDEYYKAMVKRMSENNGKVYTKEEADKEFGEVEKS